MRNLRSANLNLLPILQMLLKYRSVTQTARALQLSQSSVSEALEKLRHLFEDELIISRRNHTILTAFAQRIEPLLEASLDSLADLINVDLQGITKQKSTLDVAVSDYAIVTIGAELLQRVQMVRPDITVRFHPVDQTSADKIRSGELDLVLSSDMPGAYTDESIEKLLLFDDDIVCLVDMNSHIHGIIPKEEFKYYRHMVYFPGEEEVNDSVVYNAVSHLHIKKERVTFTSNYLLLPYLVEYSPGIALMQRRLALRLAPSAHVRIVEIPLNLNIGIFAAMYRPTIQEHGGWLAKVVHALSAENHTMRQS